MLTEWCDARCVPSQTLLKWTSPSCRLALHRREQLVLFSPLFE